MAVPAQKKLSYAEYVRMESTSEVRHELVDGEVFAMAGGSLEHSLLATTLAALLFPTLRRGACRIFGSDLRLTIIASGVSTYPDLMVVCGEAEHPEGDRQAVTNPRVVVEVLSPSTEAWDRGEKFARYRRIPSLQEVVLVSQERRRIEVYRRNDDGTWTLTEVGPDDVIRLTSVAAEVSMAELYAGVGPGV